MSKKSNKKDSNVINIVITIGIVFLIASLVLMFINSDKKDNYIKTISYNEYKEVIKKDEYFIIILTSPTCSHCNSYKPYVNYIASENNLNAYNIDITSITKDEYLELHDKYSAIRNEYNAGMPVIPTPTTIIYKNGNEIVSEVGNIGEDGFKKLLIDNKVV